MPQYLRIVRDLGTDEVSLQANQVIVNFEIRESEYGVSGDCLFDAILRFLVYGGYFPLLPTRLVGLVELA